VIFPRGFDLVIFHDFLTIFDATVSLPIHGH
jgi:hypothetical protein